MSSLTEALAADRELAAQITPPFVDQDAIYLAAREAAARHNARLDAPTQAKKGWDAKVAGIRIDQGDQSRHPWAVIGHGETATDALVDLTQKLDERALTTAPELCPVCHQALPAALQGASARKDAPG